MSIPQSKAGKKLRQEIAHIAARLVAEDGINDFHSAKIKAALQLGLNNKTDLPSNREVELALIEYQALFLGQEQKELIKEMRRSAIKAMQYFSKFSPKLVGPVLTGTATEHSEITLHVYTDDTEMIGFRLDDGGIPHEMFEKIIRVDNNRQLSLPAYQFLADNFFIHIVVFSDKQKSLSPLSSSTNKPMERASLKKLQSIQSDCE